MLILPLDHSEPYFATLGVMLYPAVDDADPPKARAYVAQVLARAFSRFREAGGSPPHDVLAPVLMDAGEPLSDLQERWWGGSATGELFKTFFALYNTDPALASWAHAIQIVELITKNSEVKGSRTTLLEARDRFLTVAHLWGARAIRGGTLVLHPEIGYDERADFQSFLPKPRFFVSGDRPGSNGARPASRRYRQRSGAFRGIGNRRCGSPAGLKRA